MLCPVCSQNEAIRDKTLGILPCLVCKERQSNINKPYSNVEFTTEEVREGRRKYFKSTIQPWREGVPSKEYQDAYPERANKMFKKYKKSEIKNVWSDIAPSGGIGRTK